MELSKKLFYNSLKPLKVDGTWTMDQYALSFNGSNIRWETFSGHTEEDVSALRMIDFGQLCLTFCEEAGHLNDAEIWISYELALLTSVIEGDASM